MQTATLDNALFMFQPLRNFLEEHLDTWSYINLLMCNKTTYSSHQRCGRRTVPDLLRPPSNLFWLRFVFRPWLSCTELCQFIRVHHALADHNGMAPLLLRWSGDGRNLPTAANALSASSEESASVSHQDELFCATLYIHNDGTCNMRLSDQRQLRTSALDEESRERVRSVDEQLEYTLDCIARWLKDAQYTSAHWERSLAQTAEANGALVVAEWITEYRIETFATPSHIEYWRRKMNL